MPIPKATDARFRYAVRETRHFFSSAPHLRPRHAVSYLPGRYQTRDVARAIIGALDSAVYRTANNEYSRPTYRAVLLPLADKHDGETFGDHDEKSEMLFGKFRLLAVRYDDLRDFPGYGFDVPIPGWVYAPDTIGGWVEDHGEGTPDRYRATIENDEVVSDDLETVERAVYEWARHAAGI